jgi:hypothetical protein
MEHLARARNVDRSACATSGPMCLSRSSASWSVLDSDPARRYRTAGELKVRCGNRSTQPPEIVCPIAPPLAARRPRLAFAHAAAAAAVVAAIVAGLLWRLAARARFDRIVTGDPDDCVLPLVEEAGSSTPSLFVPGFTDELIATLAKSTHCASCRWPL